jgi:hypothetical protein
VPSLRIGLGLWCWALFWIFFWPSSRIGHIPFPVTTAKLLGDFYNNRRSAVNSFPRFAYSSLSLCCANTICSAIHTLPKGEAQRTKKKNPRKLCIGATNSPRFAYRSGERSPASPIRQRPRSAKNISCGSYIAPILLALHRLHCFAYWSRTRL